MAAPVLVTGGSGTLGREVVRQLRDQARAARVFSRREPDVALPDGVDWVVGDLRSGAGLDAALDGVPAVVHCATDGRTAGADMDAARQLIEAASRAGAPHLVYVSIVGVDLVPLRYYREKLAVERLLERSGLPWTTLRATQFHDLIETMVRLLTRLPVVPVPARTSFQPVDVADVAERLVRLAAGEPASRVSDLGGPQVLSAAFLAHSYLRTRRRRRPVVPVWLPGRVARGYRSGGHLTPEHAEGHRTWEEYLAAVVRP